MMSYMMMQILVIVLYMCNVQFCTVLVNVFFYYATEDMSVSTRIFTVFIHTYTSTMYIPTKKYPMFTYIPTLYIIYTVAFQDHP